MKTLSILALTLLITGCGTSKVWYQPGVTEAQTERDFADCRLFGALRVKAGQIHYSPGPGSGGAFLADALAQNGQRNEIIHDCMIVKGYRLTPKSQAKYTPDIFDQITATNTTP